MKYLTIGLSHVGSSRLPGLGRLLFHNQMLETFYDMRSHNGLDTFTICRTLDSELPKSFITLFFAPYILLSIATSIVTIRNTKDLVLIISRNCAYVV